MLWSAAIVGDIAPSDNVTKEVKHQLETEAMLKIRHMLGHDTTAGGDQIRSAQTCFCAECVLLAGVWQPTCF